MALTACSGGNEEVVLKNGVIVSGQANVPNGCAVMFHFATFQQTNSAVREVRKARALTQFVCCDESGRVASSFSDNREIFGRPIVCLKSNVSIGFLDFNLICSSDNVNFLDNSTSLNLSSWTGLGADVTGYIAKHNTAYYLYNLGTGAIDGQYSTILRLVDSQTSYDVVIPYSVTYVAYDAIRDQFIYRVRDHSTNFTYGIINYDMDADQYCFNEPTNSVSLDVMLNKYGGYADDGYRILVDDNVVYEMLAVPVNVAVLKDLHLSADYLDDWEHRWGVLLLRTIDLNNGTYNLEYLTTKAFEGDADYGFLMSGTQQMPAAVVNGKLYLFTCDEKLSIYDPQTGFAQYDVKFDSAETLAPNDLFGSDSRGGSTLGDRSPVRICDDGSLYTAHAYSDGTIKIHKYNFSEQHFDLYWTSETEILDILDKQSLEFVSFDFVN